MDKDRIIGAANQAKGAIKEATGKAFDDASLVDSGKIDTAKGKLQSAVGGLRDATRDATKEALKK